MTRDSVTDGKIAEDNVSLIGMPGAGKSTIGVLLAKRIARGFLDTDLLIQEQQSTPLREIIGRRGADAFRLIEQECVLRIAPTGCVIATGGSVVYSDEAMRHLKRLGVVVYLDVPASELEDRVGDLGARGVIRKPGQGIAALQQDRGPLYERWADVRIDCASRGHEEILDAIEAALRIAREVTAKGSKERR